MARVHRQPVATPAGSQLHAVFSPFPTVCFILALLTDIAYWQTANLMWQNFSDWLLFAGLVGGGLAWLVEIFGLFRRDPRGHRSYWAHAACSALVLLLAFFNSLVHSSDGWTAVMPWGLTLSVLTVLLLLVTNYYGLIIERRQRVLDAQQTSSVVYE